MNRQSSLRLAVARRAAAAYAANRNVAAIVLGGSTARGHADRYSDVELGVFWHQAPGEPKRAAAVQATGGDLIRLYPLDEAEQVWSDDIMLGRAAPDWPRTGLLIEVVHYTTDYMAQVLDEVLEGHDPRPAEAEPDRRRAGRAPAARRQVGARVAAACGRVPGGVGAGGGPKARAD